MNGQRRPNRSTRTRIENALDWPVGTILNLLTGEMTPDDVAAIVDLTRVPTVDRRIVVDLDVPLDVWQALDYLDRADVLQTAKLAGIRRLAEITDRIERTGDGASP